jgi:hypothetical protein
MSFFNKKKEVKLEDFCFHYYENVYLNLKVEEVKNAYDYLRKSVFEADNSFANVNPNKFTSEMIALQFELFALAWIHKFGDKLAIIQSAFTKRYLHEKGKDDIWNGMEYYNGAVSHSSTVGLDKVNLASRTRMKFAIADKYIDAATKGGKDIDDSMGRPINRLFSENAWKKGTTAYFLILALCHQLGLGSGPDYLGPNEKAQLQLAEWIHAHYDGVYRALNEIKIKGS